MKKKIAAALLSFAILGINCSYAKPLKKKLPFAKSILSAETPAITPTVEEADKIFLKNINGDKKLIKFYGQLKARNYPDTKIMNSYEKKALFQNIALLFGVNLNLEKTTVFDNQMIDNYLDLYKIYFTKFDFYKDSMSYNIGKNFLILREAKFYTGETFKIWENELSNSIDNKVIEAYTNYPSIDWNGLEKKGYFNYFNALPSLAEEYLQIAECAEKENAFDEAFIEKTIAAYDLQDVGTLPHLVLKQILADSSISNTEKLERIKKYSDCIPEGWQIEAAEDVYKYITSLHASGYTGSEIKQIISSNFGVIVPSEKVAPVKKKEVMNLNEIVDEAENAVDETAKKADETVKKADEAAQKANETEQKADEAVKNVSDKLKETTKDTAKEAVKEIPIPAVKEIPVPAAKETIQAPAPEAIKEAVKEVVKEEAKAPAAQAAKETAETVKETAKETVQEAAKEAPKPLPTAEEAKEQLAPDPKIEQNVQNLTPEVKKEAQEIKKEAEPEIQMPIIEKGLQILEKEQKEQAQKAADTEKEQPAAENKENKPVAKQENNAEEKPAVNVQNETKGQEEKALENNPEMEEIRLDIHSKEDVKAKKPEEIKKEAEQDKKASKKDTKADKKPVAEKKVLLEDEEGVSEEEVTDETVRMFMQAIEAAAQAEAAKENGEEE